MTWRLVPAILLATLPSSGGSSFAQDPDQSVLSPPIIESPTPTMPPQAEEHRLSDSTRKERDDAAYVLGELRGQVRATPDDAEIRLLLAQGLSRIGDLDAAVEECRVAIRLKPDDAKAHLQLGVLLIVKQEWRAAVSVLKEALTLNPALTQAHYNLGSVQYSLGNVKAAIQSYRHALELQPYFPDARYRLALLLKLTKQDREAGQLMEEAAIGGVPQAQFFLGNAYKNGQGVEKHLGLAVFWWSKAASFHHQPAAEALAKVRRQALAPDQSPRKRQEALDAFRTYRDKLWEAFPDYHRTSDGETLGSRLAQDRRIEDALSALLSETDALSEPATAELARLYETGSNPQLTPFDPRILVCLDRTAGDGFLPAKKTLARVYAKGLGVPPDPSRAKALLQGLPKADAAALADELGLR